MSRMGVRFLRRVRPEVAGQNYSVFNYFTDLRLEPRDSGVLGKWCPTELYFYPCMGDFFFFNRKAWGEGRSCMHRSASLLITCCWDQIPEKNQLREEMFLSSHG